MSIIKLNTYNMIIIYDINSVIYKKVPKMMLLGKTRTRRDGFRKDNRTGANLMGNVTYDRLWWRSRNRHDAYRKFLKSVRSPRRQQPSPLTTRCAADHVRPDRAGLTGGESARFFHALLDDVQIIIIIIIIIYTNSFMRLLLVPHAVVVGIFFQFGIIY